MKAVWPKVVKDMLDRNEEGAEKYNRYLRSDCPDDMLQHAYEEALDLAVYLKTLIEREKENLRCKLNNTKTGPLTQQFIPEREPETLAKHSTLFSDLQAKQEKWPESSRKSCEGTK